jgi:hypothetical protein
MRWPVLVAGLATIWLPLTCWMVIVADAIRAMRYLGRWSGYDQPDPNSLPHTVINGGEQSVMFAGALILMIGGSLMFLRRLSWRRRALVCGVALPLVWCASFCLARFDPWGIVEWWFD